MVIRIVQWLSSRPHTYTLKLHGGVYQAAGTPDIYHLEKGISFWFEAKRPEGSYGVTPLQEHTLQRINQSGGEAHVVTSLGQVQEIIQRRLDSST